MEHNEKRKGKMSFETNRGNAFKVYADDETMEAENDSRENAQGHGDAGTNKESGDLHRPVRALTEGLVNKYSKMSLNFNYSSSRNPCRALSKDTEPAEPNGADSSDGNLIVRVHDVLTNDDPSANLLAPRKRSRYEAMEMLGQGTFGQVFKCREVEDGSGELKGFVAVKVIKNRPAYFNQALTELRILRMLQQRVRGKAKQLIVELRRHFTFKNHLCFVFDLLSINLYDLLRQNQFRGLPFDLVKKLLAQLLAACAALDSIDVIHCDLKPENILLRDLNSPELVLIDFGSACTEGAQTYSYIQSRFYRAPEVLVGLPYDGAIDMWSVGCIAAELFLGLPIFPGVSEHNQLARIIDMLAAYPPEWMLRRGANTGKLFKKVTPEAPKRQDSKKSRRVQFLQDPAHVGASRFSLSKTAPAGSKYKFLSPEEYALLSKKDVDVHKSYFRYQSLKEIILKYACSSKESLEREMKRRKCFVHFLHGVLRYNPAQRWSPAQALQHPLFSETPMDCATFQPQADLKVIQRVRRIREMCDDGSMDLPVDSSDGSTSDAGQESHPNQNRKAKSQPRRIAAKKQRKSLDLGGWARGGQHEETASRVGGVGVGSAGGGGSGGGAGGTAARGFSRARALSGSVSGAAGDGSQLFFGSQSLSSAVFSTQNGFEGFQFAKGGASADAGHDMAAASGAASASGGAYTSGSDAVPPERMRHVQLSIGEIPPMYVTGAGGMPPPQHLFQHQQQQQQQQQ
eukprot:g2959.t1